MVLEVAVDLEERIEVFGGCVIKDNGILLHLIQHLIGYTEPLPTWNTTPLEYFLNFEGKNISRLKWCESDDALSRDIVFGLADWFLKHYPLDGFYKNSFSRIPVLEYILWAVWDVFSNSPCFNRRDNHCHPNLK